jgi:hypothetical protein
MQQRPLQLKNHPTNLPPFIQSRNHKSISKYVKVFHGISFTWLIGGIGCRYSGRISHFLVNHLLPPQADQAGRQLNAVVFYSAPKSGITQPIFSGNLLPGLEAWPGCFRVGHSGIF